MIVLILEKRTFSKDVYLKSDKFHRKNRDFFIMVYGFECIKKDGKHIPVA